MTRRIHRLQSERAPEVSADDRTVRGYAAVWGSVGADGLEVMPGAAQRAIDLVAAGGVIPVFYGHDYGDLPLGRLVELDEDETGLRFVARLSETHKADETLVAIDDGTVSVITIGAWIEAADETDSGYALTEIDLDEISLAPPGFAQDNSTSVHRAQARRALGLYDAAGALDTIASLKNAVDRLVEFLENPPPEWWGGPDSFTGEQLTSAILAEKDELAAYARDLLTDLFEGEDNG